MGYISHKDIYYNTHVFRSKAVMQCTSKQIESVTTEYVYYSQALKQVYLWDTAPQHAYKNKRKDFPLVVVES